MRLRRLALVAAVMLGGCALLSRTFTYMFPAVDAMAALPVVLTDSSAAVVSIGEAPAGFRPIVDAGFSPIADPNSIVVHWLGGACDASVAITVEGTAVLTIAVATTTKPGACDLVGIPRAVLIRLSRIADPSKIGVKFDGRPDPGANEQP